MAFSISLDFPVNWRQTDRILIVEGFKTDLIFYLHLCLPAQKTQVQVLEMRLSGAAEQA